LTIHVISDIDQHYQLYWVFLNNYTLVISIMCEIDQHYQLYWALLNYPHWLVLFVRLISIMNSTGLYSIISHWLVLFAIRLNLGFLNQSWRINNHKTTNRSFILVLTIKESMLSILATSWIIKNSLPMFLSNFRIKLPFVSYNYIN
jgi:hypothetical protein